MYLAKLLVNDWENKHGASIAFALVPKLYLTDKNNASESTAYSSLDQAWRSTWLYPSDPCVQPLQVFYIKDLLSVCNTFTVLDDSMHYAVNFKIRMLM